MSSPSKCPLSPWSATNCLRRTIACASDHGAKCSSTVSAAPPAATARGGHCRARIVRCSYSSTATDRSVVVAALPSPTSTPTPTTRPSVTGHGGSGGNDNGDSGRTDQETRETTKTSTSTTATTVAATRRGAGDAKTLTDMLDLSASEMELVSQRPVSHVKVQDAAEVQNKFYKFGSLLGRGAFATVMLGTERTSGDKWAIKILNKAQCGATQLALFQREIRILRAVRHPHIIHLERVLESPSALFLVLELCLCELAEVAKKKTTFTENEVRRVVQCVSSAVTYLHHKDIVHRDLKMENLLIASNPSDPNDKFYVKVTDFGLSVVRGGVGQENMLQETCGTPSYMAPELFGSRMYSQQCDIWAMGVIMYVMLTGKFPFEPRPNKPLPMVVAQEEPDLSGPAFKGDDKEPLKKLLRKMLEKNPAYRANAHDVETDPWTRNAPAEEAPAENAMELMRMWRKDLRQPSISVPGGSLGGFSNPDRRMSRISTMGGPPSVMGRDTRPRAGSMGQEIATTASGSVRRKVGKGRMPGETQISGLPPSAEGSEERISSKKSTTESEASNEDSFLDLLNFIYPPDFEKPIPPEVKRLKSSNERLKQSNERFKQSNKRLKPSKGQSQSSKDPLKPPKKSLKRQSELLKRPREWVKRPSEQLKPSSEPLEPSSEPLKPSSEQLESSREQLESSSELREPSNEQKRSSSVQLPFPPRNPKRGITPKYEYKVALAVPVNYSPKKFDQSFSNLKSFKKSSTFKKRSEVSMEPCDPEERNFTSADGTIIRIIQPARRPTLLHEHKTIKHIPSRRAAPLSVGKFFVPWTRATKMSRPSRVLFQPYLQTPLYSSSLPSNLDQYPYEDNLQFPMKISENTVTEPHQRRESPCAGHPLRHFSDEDRYLQLKKLLERHTSSSSQVPYDSVRQRLTLLRTGRRATTPIASHVLRRGLVAVDERRARNVAERGSSTVLLPPVLAPPIVYMQRERRKTVTPMDISEEEMLEEMSHLTFNWRSTHRFSQSKRMCSRIAPQIEMWPITT